MESRYFGFQTLKAAVLTLLFLNLTSFNWGGYIHSIIFVYLQRMIIIIGN